MEGGGTGLILINFTNTPVTVGRQGEHPETSMIQAEKVLLHSALWCLHW